MGQTSETRNKVLIIDFGSQLTQLIARRVREIGVYSEILPYFALEAIEKVEARGVILAGSSESVYDELSPAIPEVIFSWQVPILGICYGQQALCVSFGGKVIKSSKREFGRSYIKILKESAIFDGFVSWISNNGDISPDPAISEGNESRDSDKLRDDEPKEFQVWMSHGDSITELPDSFEVIASSTNAPFAAIAHSNRDIYGVQFHPEVIHTTNGKKLIENFVKKICKCDETWQMSSFVDQAIAQIRSQVRDEKVVCAVSGGVDSSVVASLLHKAIGSNLYCVFIDNGLLRKGEGDEVVKELSKNFPLIHVNAQDAFFKALEGVSDPEEKRKAIGRVFIETFYQEIQKIGNVKYLAQGTIYPDVIESLAHANGKNTTIKSHHNVGGLPQDMRGLELIEPLRSLFKDEVRALAEELSIPSKVLNRHPFPGPGLAIRIIGEVTPAKCKLLCEADSIFMEELHRAGLYDEVWQAYAALLPIKSVGVMGDGRAYQDTCVLRAVTSTDGMTADFASLPHDFLGLVARRIINEVEGIGRVFYDITSKPPATIELE